MAEQAAFGGVFDAAGITQFFDFTDIVKDDAREKQIGVELGVMLGNGAREADEVLYEGKPVGRVTSSVSGLALAYVRVEVPDGAEVEVGGLKARLH